MGEYGFGDIVRVTGLTANEWIALQRAGVVPPSARDTSGPGDYRKYSARDVLTAKLAAELKAAKMTSRHIIAVLAALDAAEKFGPGVRQQIILVTFEGDPGKRTPRWWIGSRDRLARELNEGVIPPFALLFQLDVLRQQISAALGEDI